MAESKAEMSNKLTEHKTTTKIMVAAIYFGTTYSGWAFSFHNENKKEPTISFVKTWNSGKHISPKAPTTVLIKPDGKTIEAFGYEAEDRYADLVEDKEHGSYYYFQRFKMLLYDKKIEIISKLFYIYWLSRRQDNNPLDIEKHVNGFFRCTSVCGFTCLKQH